MRLLVVTNWFPSRKSPISGIFVKRDTELLARDHEVTLVHLAAPGEFGPDDISDDTSAPFRVVRVARSRRTPFGNVARRADLNPFLAEADILHTHAFSTLLSFGGRKVFIPWVHSEHWSAIGDPKTLNRPGRLAISVIGRLLNKLDAVTAVSRHLANGIRRFRRGPTLVVPSVVTSPSAVTPFPDRSVMRLVSVGNLIPHKGPVATAEAVRELTARGYTVELEWAGEGKERAALEALAVPGVTLHGAIPGGEVARLLNAAHIFVLPTRSETLGLAILEALGHGRPVVVGGRGGPQDYVNDANGTLLTKLDHLSVADAIEREWLKLPSRDPLAIAATIADRYAEPTVRQAYKAAFSQARALH